MHWSVDALLRPNILKYIDFGSNGLFLFSILEIEPRRGVS